MPIQTVSLTLYSWRFHEWNRNAERERENLHEFLQENSFICWNTHKDQLTYKLYKWTSSFGLLFTNQHQSVINLELIDNS